MEFIEQAVSFHQLLTVALKSDEDAQARGQGMTRMGCMEPLHQRVPELGFPLFAVQSVDDLLELVEAQQQTRRSSQARGGGVQQQTQFLVQGFDTQVR